MVSRRIIASEDNPTLLRAESNSLYRHRRMPLDPKQRHKLLMADRTRDAAWITAAIEHLCSHTDWGGRDEEIARTVSVSLSTVGRTKRRFVEGNLERALTRSRVRRRAQANRQGQPMLVATIASRTRP